ncbi:hypothetical protein D3C81_1134300 [compost metagenome]
MRQENHSDTILPWFWKTEAQLLGFKCEEAVWKLNHDPCSIAGVRLTALAAAVLHINKHSQRLADNIVRRPSFNMSNKTHTTGIFFKSRVI